MIKEIYRKIIPEHLRNDIAFYLGRKVYRPVKIIGGKKIIFVHIPKTGGTSIGEMLGFSETRNYFIDKKDSRIISENHSLKSTLEHRDCKELIRIVGPKVWDSAFKFSIVRNPWDRAYSWYKFNIKLNKHRMRQDQISFEDWIIESFERKNSKYFFNTKLFQSQYDFLSDDTGELAVDFIGRFENLRDELDRIKKIIPIQGQLQHLNPTKKDNYQTVYSEYSKNTVAQHYFKDIKEWNYSF